MSEPTQPIDEVLRDYYRSEMPDPWPAPPTPEPVALASRQASAWTMHHSRLIAGASVVALVTAYLGLATLFPRPQARTLDPNQSPTIGHRPGLDPGKAAVRPMP